MTAAAAVLTAMLAAALLAAPSAEARQRAKVHHIGILTMPQSLLRRADHAID